MQYEILLIHVRQRALYSLKYRIPLLSHLSIYPSLGIGKCCRQLNILSKKQTNKEMRNKKRFFNTMEVIFAK